IARSAGGSMRDALSLLDQAIAHGAGQVDEAQVRSMLGSVDQDHLFSILEALPAGDAGALLQVAANLALRGLSFAVALQELAALLTRIQIVQCVPEAGDDDDPDRERIQLLARALSAEFIQLAYQIVTVGRSELALAPDEHAGFVMTLLRLHAFRPRSVGEIVEAYRPAVTPPVRQALPSAAPVAPSMQPVVTAPPAVVAAESAAEERPRPAAGQTMTGPAADWPALLAALPISGLVRTLAANCELRELGEGHCLLRLPSEFSHLQMKPNPDKLQQALSDYLGRTIRLTIEAGATAVETPAAAQGRQRQERQEQAEMAIRNDDFVREAEDLFAASVVEASIKPID
ncbi:MAG: DNA polymerase III subunit gamma/tau C-terminal domain-containing protein, partial [Azonexus sp.]|nr:DNA polymerase III subunit gamma/tau C-terminal domain-containing protein [Azonexus sp.]